MNRFRTPNCDVKGSFLSRTIKVMRHSHKAVAKIWDTKTVSHGPSRKSGQYKNFAGLGHRNNQKIQAFEY